MYIQFSCEVSKDSKEWIEKLLQLWSEHNSFINNDDWILEVLKVFSRGYTKAVTFLARFGQPNQERVTRVFKVDYLENTLKEAHAATWLATTISANFFCRIKNNPENYHWQDPSGQKIGIIEYEYAGDLGTSESVDTLMSYLFDQYKKSSRDSIKVLGTGLTRIFDDVIQGLKTKLYKRHKTYNVRVKDVYTTKLTHFTQESVEKLLYNIPPHLKKLFPEPPQVLFEAIDLSLNFQLDTHYFSDYIHGDLNPTNILVYRGYDRAYGTLIDYLEMENKKAEGFTPYFWDFARLEGELALSFFTKTFIPPEQISESLPKLSQSLFEMAPLKDHHSPLAIMSDTLVRLRKSFFRTEGLHLDISFDSPDVIKSFYYNLLVFYLFILKYENSHLECLVALALARDLAEQIPKIDSKWVAEKLEEPKEAEGKTTLSKRRIRAATLATLSLAIIILSVWFLAAYLSKPAISLDRLKEADNFASQNLCGEALPIYKELLKTLPSSNNEKIYAKIKYSAGKCYYKEALIKNREKNLKKAALSLQEAIKFINQKDHPIQYSDAVNHLSVVYLHLAEVRDKAGYADKAIRILKPIHEMHQNNNRPFYAAMTQTNLGIAYWRLSQVRDKLKNVNKSMKLLNSALKVLSGDKSSMDYAKAQHYLGNTYGESFSLDNSEENLYLAIKAYEDALRIRTLENHPQEYSWTQNNLGVIYRKLAYMEGNTNPEKDIKKAIQIYLETLKVKTLKNYPFDYARTQINLGQVYSDLAKVSDQEEIKANLEKAVQVYQDLLKNYNAEEYPIYYASANLNLGAVYYFLSEDRKLVSQKEKDLTQSIISYKNALRIFTIKKYPVNYAGIQKNLMFVYNDLADIKDKEENCQNALTASVEALSILTSTNHPRDFKIINEASKIIKRKLTEITQSK